MKIRIYDTYYTDKIYLWGKNKNTYCLHVKNFNYSAYVSLPIRINNRIVEWSNENDAIRLNILKKLSKIENFRFEIVFKYPSDGYIEHPKPFIKVIAPSHRDLKRKEKEINLILLDLMCCKWYETDISPCIKLYIEKKWDISNILEFNLKGAEIMDTYEEFLDNEELSVFSYNNVIHINIDADKLTQVDDNINTLKIVYFDIETYSSTGGFPNSCLPNDIIYLFSMVFEIYKRPETRKKIIVAIGGKSTPDIKECIYVKNETELLKTSFEIMAREQPDVISGYNIHAFDIPYIEMRMALNGLPIPMEMSRLPTEEPVFSIIRGKRGRRLSTIHCPGRIIIDLYTYIIADTAFAKLPSYKLTDVLKRYVPNELQKTSLGYKEQFEIFYNFITGKNIEKYKDVILYCLRDSEALCALMAKRNVIESCINMSKVQKTSIQNVVTAGSVQRSYNLIYAACVKADVIMVPRQNVTSVEFDGGLVYLDSPGRHNNVAIMDFNSLYPSEIDSNNLCFTTLVPIHLDVSDVNTIDVKYKYVDTEVNSESENDSEDNIPVENLTKSKLQKKIKEIVEFKNDMKETKETLKFVKSNVRRGVVPEIVSNLIKARKEVKNSLHSLKTNLITLGKSFKLNMNDVDLETFINHASFNELVNVGISEDNASNCINIQENILDLDLRQNAIKVVTNSIYGIMGSPADYGNPFVAMATCAFGRKHITETAKLFLKSYKNSNVVYIDTDSVFLELPMSRYVFTDTLNSKFWIEYKPKLTFSEETLKRTNIVNEWINEYKNFAKNYTIKASRIIGNELCTLANNANLYQKPMNLGFEGFGSGVWVIKKMYMMNIISEDGLIETKLRGIPLRRGDYPKIVKNVYAKLVKDLLDGVDYVNCVRNSIPIIRHIFENASIDEFKITTQFQKITVYKSISAPMAKLAIAAKKDGFPLEDYSLIENVKILEEPKLATMDMYNTGKYTLDKLHYFNIIQTRMDRTLSPLLDERYFWIGSNIKELKKPCNYHKKITPGCNFCYNIHAEGMLWETIKFYECMGLSFGIFGLVNTFKIVDILIKKLLID